MNDPREYVDLGPLFPDPPAQRHSETSRAAALSMKPRAGNLRALVLAFIRSRGEGGATDEEIQEALAMPASTQRPRRIELVSGALVVDSGLTRPTRSGRQATVWRAAA